MFSRFTDIDLFVLLTTLPMFTAIVLRLFSNEVEFSWLKILQLLLRM